MKYFEQIQVVYFEAQTGVIRDKPPTYTNFYQYKIPAQCREDVLNMCADASIGPHGFNFSKDQLKKLKEMEVD